jgi:hypothetical protein
MSIGEDGISVLNKVETQVSWIKLAGCPGVFLLADMYVIA